MNKTELRQNLKEITALFLCFAVIAVGTVFFIDPARLYNFELTASAAEAAPEGPEAIPAEEEPGPERFAVDTEGITAGPMTVALRDYANSIEPQPEQTGAAPTLSQQWSWLMAHQDEFPGKVVKYAAENPDLIAFLYEYGCVYQFGKISREAPAPDNLATYTPEEMAQPVPVFYQWDPRWGYLPYGSSVIGITGCGPTCLSMVMVGLTGDTTLSPRAIATFAEENGYYEDGDGTRWALMQDYAFSKGLSCKQVPITEESVRAELEAGHLLVCSMGPGDFTIQGHFIVITGTEGDGFRVHDPNSRANTARTWTFEEMRHQIWAVFTFAQEDLFAE